VLAMPSSWRGLGFLALAAGCGADLSQIGGDIGKGVIDGIGGLVSGAGKTIAHTIGGAVDGAGKAIDHQATSIHNQFVSPSPPPLPPGPPLSPPLSPPPSPRIPPMNPPPLPPPPRNLCFSAHGWGPHGEGFLGTVAETEDGIECQPWGRQWPHAHIDLRPEMYPNASLQHNFCRNPSGKGLKPRQAPWCYTTSADTVWQYCQVCMANETLLAPAPPSPPTHHGPGAWVGFLALGTVALLALAICAYLCFRLNGDECPSLPLMLRGPTEPRMPKIRPVRPPPDENLATKPLTAADDGAQLQPHSTARPEASVPRQQMRQPTRAERERERRAGTFAALASLAAHQSSSQQESTSDARADPSTNLGSSLLANAAGSWPVRSPLQEQAVPPGARSPQLLLPSAPSAPQQDI